jgi:hypothetical protein
MDRRNFLEISPYQADRGELIGGPPTEVPSEILSLKFRALLRRPFGRSV